MIELTDVATVSDDATTDDVSDVPDTDVSEDVVDVIVSTDVKPDITTVDVATASVENEVDDTADKMLVEEVSVTEEADSKVAEFKVELLIDRTGKDDVVEEI